MIMRNGGKAEMKTRILLIAAAVLLCGCGESSQAPESSSVNGESSVVSSPGAVCSGTCGKDLSWSLDESGRLKISGSGEMAAMTAGSAPWWLLKDNIKTVELSDGVTSVGAGSFAGCAYLVGIEIPKSVTAIGSSAFDGCTSLKSITIPDSVTQLGEKAFWNCEGLESAVVGKGVRELGYNTFCKCHSLTTVKLSQGLERIGDCAFEYCTSLTEITIPETVTSMGYNVFPLGELVIKGKAGSAAQQYSERTGHSFKAE